MLDKRHHLPFLACFLLILVSFSNLILQSGGFVLQLPECGRYNGNFSERHDGHYFASNISKTVTNVTRKDCSLYCSLHLGCLFFNHKKDNSVCHLLNSHRGALTPDDSWQFVSTSYKNVHLRGPLCRYLGNTICPTEGTHCIDSCNAPGFECITDKNIAAGKRVVASSVWVNPQTGARAARYAVDELPGTAWNPDVARGAWLLVDLSERRFVAYLVWVHTSMQTFVRRMKPMQIRVGDRDENDVNGNEICVSNVDMTKERKNQIYCTKGPMWGQYVVLQRGPTELDTRFFVNEIRVFALI